MYLVKALREDGIEEVLATCRQNYIAQEVAISLRRKFANTNQYQRFRVESNLSVYDDYQVSFVE